MSDIIMVKTIEDSDATSFELYDVYNSGFDRDGVFNVTFISSWIPTSERMMYGRLRDFTILSKIARRSNLHGLNIKVVTYNEFNTENKDIVTYMEQDTQLHKDSVFKMNFRIVQLIKNIFNFTTTYLLADNWSDKNALGYYQSGNLLGILIEKKADIMAAALELSPDRLDITDTIHLTYPFRSGFVFVYEGDFGKIKLSFLTPFSDLIWYLFLALSALIMFITWFILLVESKYLPMSRKFKWKLNFSDTFLSVWAAWCQMGSGIRPTTHASKMVYFTLLLNSVVMYNFYTSSIVSSLLSYRSQAFTIPELADSPMVCGSVDVGYVHYLLFDDPQYPNMEYFNARKKTSNFYFPIEEGLSKVRAGGFAYHAEYNNMYNEISDTFAAWQICELQEVDTIPLVHLAIMGAKNSPYSELFRVGSQKIRETGQLHRLLQKWVSKRPACQANRGFSIVNFHQLFSFFILLMLGMILAILILIYERRNQRFQLHNQIQNKVNDTIKTFKKKRQDRHPDRHFYQ